jgi:hypothetical protein
MLSRKLARREAGITEVKIKTSATSAPQRGIKQQHWHAEKQR